MSKGQRLNVEDFHHQFPHHEKYEDHDDEHVRHKYWEPRHGKKHHKPHKAIDHAVEIASNAAAKVTLKRT